MLATIHPRVEDYEDSLAPCLASQPVVGRWCFWDSAELGLTALTTFSQGTVQALPICIIESLRRFAAVASDLNGVSHSKIYTLEQNGIAADRNLRDLTMAEQHAYMPYYVIAAQQPSKESLNTLSFADRCK